MILSQIKLNGFRNFKNTTVKFNEKTLIIGANDVGKTNLIWAIRLLLDRSLSDFDIEPNDTDFYVFEETNNFKITLKFENVIDDCVVSKLKGKISDDDILFLRYEAFRDIITKRKSYKLFAGSSLDSLEEIEDRFYRKVLNLKYISSRRDLTRYINKEKSFLFQNAKEDRSDEEMISDDILYSDITKNLNNIDSKIPELNFVKNATKIVNEELSKLSLHHSQQSIVFDSVASNIDSFINNVSISASAGDQSVLIGGDGRLNQIYLALWSSRNQLREDNMSEVTIFCIEEPEAHLHPHQQRKLSDYLNTEIFGQVFITSHSPQIASEFEPNSIVRLFYKDKTTKAASNGCSKIIDDSFKDFGYRMSIIPAEAFFSTAVLLVEGPSEEILYKTLAKQLDIDLDRLNISILMVDGVGFETYIKILDSLKIDWVLRTDNDIFKIPKKTQWRFAGIHRCISILNNYDEHEETVKILDENLPFLTWGEDCTPKKINLDSANTVIEELEAYDMYISAKDLESDMLNSPIIEELKKYYKSDNLDILILKMQKRKAIMMYEFLRNNKDSLKKLKDHSIARPLLRCIELVNH
ncbi:MULTISPECIES: ATP-dependent nuclease [Chryseobacterium]|nr:MULTISPECIES: AAA family ATPase [Chryseobacterium]QQQ72368.1 AAA family ATPase [Chryseobacterium indologenes]